MFNPENFILFILLVLFIMNFQFIVSTLILFFWELQDVVVKKIHLEEMDSSVQEIIKPNEKFLLSEGFVYKSSMEYNGMLVRFPELQHSNYYYNEELGVHAFIDTTPIIGAFTSSVIYFVTFYESYKRAINFDCFAYNILKTDEVYLFDHYYNNYEKAFNSHLKDRVIEGESILYQPLSAEGAKDFSQYSSSEQIEEMLNRNIIRKKGNNRYGYAFSLAYVKYIYENLKMVKMVKNIYDLKEREKSETLTDTQKIFTQTTEERTILAHLEQKPKEKSKEGKMRTFVISGITFVLFFGLIGIPWSSLPIIILILIIHELGHYFAMKYYGYKDTSIFFIPLFGAAAKGEKEHTNAFEEYIIFLAGPLPGMILSIIIGVLIINEPSLVKVPMLEEFMISSFVINFINLLPIYPLDGGRVVQTLVFTRFPKARFYFYLLSLLIIILSAISLKSIILTFIAVVLFFNINHNYHLALLLSDLKNNRGKEVIKEEVVNSVVNNKRFKKLRIERKTLLVKEALKSLKSDVSTYLLMFLGMTFYLFLLLSSIILMGIFL